jgi:hypothetical protein
LSGHRNEIDSCKWCHKVRSVISGDQHGVLSATRKGEQLYFETLIADHKKYTSHKMLKCKFWHQS